jgi:hypothetical protein
MRNIWKREAWSRKVATASNKKRIAVNNKNINMKIRWSKRIKSGRIIRHVKRSTRIQNP